MRKNRLKHILLHELGEPRTQRELAVKGNLTENTVTKFTKNETVSEVTIVKILNGLNRMSKGKVFTEKDLYE